MFGVQLAGGLGVMGGMQIVPMGYLGMMLRGHHKPRGIVMFGDWDELTKRGFFTCWSATFS